MRVSLPDWSEIRGNSRVNVLTRCGEVPIVRVVRRVLGRAFHVSKEEPSCQPTMLSGIQTAVSSYSATISTNTARYYICIHDYPHNQPGKCICQSVLASLTMLSDIESIDGTL